MKKLLLLGCCCLLCAACAARPLVPPTKKPQNVLHFSAWHSLGSVEVPLQGVVHVQHDPAAGPQLERLGVVLSHGTTVGVTVWDAHGKARRKTGDVPGSYNLLTATEDCMAALLRLRGVAVPGKAADGAENVPTGLADPAGPLEMRCTQQDSRLTVRITKEQR